MATFPNPRYDVGDRSQVLLGYLDYFRATVAEKLSGLDARALRTTLLSSGWTPLELVQHLVAMERRWLVWGFLAEPVPNPWRDEDTSGRWHVASDVAIDELLAALQDGGRRTREIVTAAELGTVAGAGGRFTADDPPPTLERILLHVLQEYARHVGHLDIVRELTDGAVGE